MEFEALNWEAVSTTLIEWGILLVKAIAVYLIGKIIAGIVLRVLARLLRRAHTDEMLQRFILSICGAALSLIVVIVALGVLGIDTTSLIAVLGAAGLAIGLALQDSLKNFAAGVMLLVFKPFTKGDFIEAGGIDGVVQEIELFSTSLKTTDNKLVVVPNGAIWSGVIVNYTAEDLRRVDMVFGIGYGDDIQTARSVIEQVLSEESRIVEEPAPQIAVSELADSSVNFVVRPWVKTEDYWSVRFAVTEAVKTAFDARGVSIPFPQMDVHMDRVA